MLFEEPNDISAIRPALAIIRSHAGGGLEVIAFDLRAQAPHDERIDIGGWDAHPAGVSAKGSFFTRGSGHNKLGGYTEIPDEYQEVMDRLLRKHQAAARDVPPAIIRAPHGRTLAAPASASSRWATATRRCARESMS